MGEVKDLEIRQATLVRADHSGYMKPSLPPKGWTPGSRMGVPSIPDLGVRSGSAGEIGAQIK